MGAKQSPRERSKAKAQGEDADFLIEEFDMQAGDAAGLVAGDGADADKVAAQARSREKGKDPLRGKPAAEEPATERVADTDEQALKPVLHKENRRSGAG